MDEIVGRTTLKYLRQIQLVLTRIPFRELHKFQVSINHEVQPLVCRKKEEGSNNIVVGDRATG
jgi:hypothetical protein